MCLTRVGRPEFPARDIELLKSAKSLKQVLNREWGGAFWRDDKVDFFQKELKRVTKEAYKQKIEQNVPCNNMKKGMGGDEFNGWTQREERKCIRTVFSYKGIR